MKKKELGKISRRDFLKDAGILVGGAALGSSMLLAACAGEETTKTVTQTATTTQTLPGETTTTTQTTTVAGPTITQTVEIPATTKTVTVTGVAPGPITVLTPTGTFAPVQRQQLAERPSSLDGKKIYLIDISFSGSYDLADAMGEWFQNNRPELDVVVTTEIGSYTSAQEDVLFSEIRDNNGVAAVIGGH